MKKLFLFSCLLMAVASWAAKPEVIRAYDLAEGGYVLVDAQNEVIGFCEEGTAESQKSKLADFLCRDGKALEIRNELAPQEIMLQFEIVDSVGPLLGDIAYNQGAPYKNMCPIDPSTNERCVTGCVATAMAQICAYHKWPKKCKEGTHTYTSSAKKIQCTYVYTDHEFDWDNILPYYPNHGKDCTEAQRNAIADLMLACGVGVDMNYTSKSSGSQSVRVPNVFMEYFDYQECELESRENTFLNDEEFIKAMVAEIDAKRPIYVSAQYSGTQVDDFDGGHAFVLDGYGRTQSEVTNGTYKKPYFHFNWGWGGVDQSGSRNLWYRLTGDIDKSPYTANIEIIRNIRPNDGTPIEETFEDINKVEDNRILDLLGREVSETIPGQLYIRNGVKFLAQ